jgi:hypothetical protein
MNDEDFLVTQEIIDQIQAAMKPRFVSTNYTATYNDNVLVVDSSLANVAVVLPAAKNGKEFIVVKSAAANTVTVSFTGADTLFGSSNIAMLNLSDSKRFKSIVGGYITL